MPKKKSSGEGLFGDIAKPNPKDAKDAEIKKKADGVDFSPAQGAAVRRVASTRARRTIASEDAGGKEVAAVAPEERVFGVAEFIEILNTFFKREKVRLRGEICELKRAASGHVYFTLKDKSDGAVMDSIIWNRNYEMCGVALEIGMEVIASGHPNIYAPSGRLSFVADTVELVGEGALKKAYDALKKKLEAEGLFAPERKRPLPEFVRKVGVVTSLKGAVIHDFENNLGKFGFVISVCDARVEGQQAVKPILAALATLAKEDIEALVVIRGGGSLESLQGFNNEAVVRAIADFPVPVIAGIGHDQDVPLAALAADYMTSTPTAAAHLLGRSWEDAFAKAERLRSVFVYFEEGLRRAHMMLDGTLDGIIQRIAHRIASLKDQLAYAERAVVLNDPARQLKLGYAIVRSGGRIVKSVKDVAEGDALETQLADGTVGSKITEKR